MSHEARKGAIGFIGLGGRSAPLAERLLQSGYPLVTWDGEPSTARRFMALGTRDVRTPADVALHASTVICAVDTGAEVEAVLTGPQGVGESAMSGDVVICMSTIDPAVLKRVHARMAEQGIDVIDAPVTTERRGNAEVLRAYAGGDTTALERVRPVLQAMVPEVVYFGAAGNGLAMKHVVNMLAQVNRILIVEALAMGSEAGLDLKQMIDTILDSKGNSAAFQRLAPRILARDFGGIPLRITCEDVELQTEMANSLHMPVFMASTALQVYKMGVAMGLGDKDSAAVMQVYERYAGATDAPVLTKSGKSDPSPFRGR